MQLFNVYPIYNIEPVKAMGSYLWDNQGTQYLDLYGGHAVISIGHSHPKYVKAITDQVNKLGFYSNSVKISQQEELAYKLGVVCGHENYFLFMTNSGAESNENALKLASFANGRKKVISFSKGFHGRTSLAVAVTDNSSIIAPVNETDNAVILPFNDSQALTDYFSKNGNLVSSVIVEGIQGVGGINVATEEFLKTIRTLCDQYGAYYIADSVQCGYGRTGKFFAHDWSGIDADIYTMAKGMGNGFPVGGIIISPKFKPKMGMLGTTFGGNHLACVAAISVLDVIVEENLLENAFMIGQYTIREVAKLPYVKEVRGRGLMIGIEFEMPCEDIRKSLIFDHKIFVGNASNKNVIRLLPALNVDKTAIDQFLNSCNEILIKL